MHQRLATISYIEAVFNYTSNLEIIEKLAQVNGPFILNAL